MLKVLTVQMYCQESLLHSLAELHAANHSTGSQGRQVSLWRDVGHPVTLILVNGSNGDGVCLALSSEVLSDCHFQPVSSLTLNRLPASTSGDNSMFPGPLLGAIAGSDRLPSKSPM